MPWQEGKTGAVCLPRSSTHSRMLPWADRDLNLQQDQGPMRRKRRRRRRRKRPLWGRRCHTRARAIGPSGHSSAWPRPRHPLANISPGTSPRPGPPQRPKCPQGRVGPPQGLGRGSPRRAGVARRLSGQRRGGWPEQNTQAQRARLCWSILFQSCGWFWVVGFSFPLSSRLTTTAQPSRAPAGMGQQRGPQRCPGLLGVLNFPRGGRRPTGRCGQHTTETERGSYVSADQPGETEHRRSWARKERRFSEGEKERR